MSRIGARTGRICWIWRWLGRKRFTAAITLLSCFADPVGSSNDCICTNSSFTTPPVPSLTTALRTTAGVRARKKPPVRPTSTALLESPTTPPRAVAIASISSMNPIAPPSALAALRRATK